ncbi:pentapeptide repeat-containing protein [Amycolatopsis sp. H20-H5]|nr:pentapeptide repeat-containing protein [Amycolatopsis sp. H20-H5]
MATIVLGAGGFVALLLAARRQQTAEQDLATKRRDLWLREKANDDARHDAVERRITELYLKSVEQLGSDKAPVRLSGLYALDRLAQDNSSQRQTIVNVVSAYLRMPYELPGGVPVPEADKEVREEYSSRMQEREVRLTAQRILTGHLDPQHGDGSRFWEGVDLDLSGALLVDFTVRGGRINNARFLESRFVGDVLLMGVSFTGETRFEGATFEGDSWFSEADFQGNVRFDRARFVGDARFDEATFTGATVFRDTVFTRDARFDKVAFTGAVVFSGAAFTRDASFGEASFIEDLWLPGAIFSRHADFDRATFARDAWFSRVAFSSRTSFAEANFVGNIRFTDATLDGVPYLPEQLRSEAAYDGQSID